MSKETVNQETPIEEVKKVSRRGLGSARGTARLKFGNDQAKPNGLFLGHLEEVKYSTITIGEDKTGMPSFNGFEIPKLTLTFASNEEDPNKRHYVSKTFTAVESNVNTIPGGKEEWKVNSVFDWLKHVLNVYDHKRANILIRLSTYEISYLYLESFLLFQNTFLL